MYGARCRACGAVGHPSRPPAFPKLRAGDLEVGRGIILCDICDLPLSLHSLDTHPIPELSERRLRSSGVPYRDQRGHAYG